MYIRTTNKSCIFKLQFLLLPRRLLMVIINNTYVLLDAIMYCILLSLIGFKGDVVIHVICNSDLKFISVTFHKQ